MLTSENWMKKKKRLIINFLAALILREFLFSSFQIFLKIYFSTKLTLYYSFHMHVHTHEEEEGSSIFFSETMHHLFFFFLPFLLLLFSLLSSKPDAWRKGRNHRKHTSKQASKQAFISWPFPTFSLSKRDLHLCSNTPRRERKKNSCFTLLLFSYNTGSRIKQEGATCFYVLSFSLLLSLLYFSCFPFGIPNTEW